MITNQNLYKFAALSGDTIDDLTNAFMLYNDTGWNHDEHARQRIENKMSDDRTNPFLYNDYRNDDDLYSLGLDYYSKYNDKTDRWKDALDYYKSRLDWYKAHPPVSDYDKKAVQIVSEEIKRIETKHKMDMVLHNLLKNINKQNTPKYNLLGRIKRKLTGNQDNPLYNYDKTKALLEFEKPSLGAVDKARSDLDRMMKQIDKTKLYDYYVDQVRLLRRLGLKS